MDTPLQGKRKMSIESADSKKQRRMSFIPKTVKTNMRKSSNRRTTRDNGGRGCQTTSPTLVKNNRELATALNKAKSRIRELENERFELQSEQHRLREKYSVLTKQLEKMKDERAAKQYVDSEIFKETCELLRSKMEKATEKLLESSVFLTEVDNSVVALLRMSDSQSRKNENSSLELSVPLEITCDDDSMQRSNEAALSITKLTPSPSSASSSDSCEMASPDPCASSTPSENRPGLLTTIQDQSSVLEWTDSTKRVLDLTQISPTVNKVLNTCQESMDCHNNSQDFVSTCVQQHNSMDTDSPVQNSNDQSLLWCSTPECSPIRGARRNTAHRLTSTPEDREFSRYAANLSADSPQISPAFTLCSGRRTLRRRNMMDGFRGYKEPLLNSKLRQGDPFTDCSLFQPSQRNSSKKKKTK